MKLKWKVCGMKQPENIEQALELAPDYMGFIFYEKSPRYVGGQWGGPPKDFPPETKKVGVFVNEKPNKVMTLADRYRLDYLQLHGNESPDYCQQLSEKGYLLIKVFNPEDIENGQMIEAYLPWVQYFLFDTPSKQYGGTGKTFEWSLLKQYNNPVPIFLSGGISLENVGEIGRLDQLNIAAVDVNSRFEISPGLKDIEMLKELKTRLQEL